MHRPGNTGSPIRRLALAGLCGISSGIMGGCLFLPQSTTRYENHMTLQAYQVAAFGGCRNEGCAELLVLAGAVSAASFVVSGSVVVVGEVVYWLEAKGRCMVR